MRTDGIIQFPYLRIVGPTEEERAAISTGFAWGVGAGTALCVWALVTVALGAILLKAVEAL